MPAEVSPAPRDQFCVSGNAAGEPDPQTRGAGRGARRVPAAEGGDSGSLGQFRKMTRSGEGCPTCVCPELCPYTRLG